MRTPFRAGAPCNVTPGAGGRPQKRTGGVRSGQRPLRDSEFHAMAYAYVAGPSAAGIANPAMPARALRSPLLGEIEGEEPVHAVDPF